MMQNTKSISNGKLTDIERENMIEWLLVITGWNESVFRNMTDEEVVRVYHERIVDRT